MSRMICSKCNGDRIEGTSWVSLNTGKTDGGEAPSEALWCPDCESKDVEAVEVPQRGPCFDETTARELLELRVGAWSERDLVSFCGVETELEAIAEDRTGAAYHQLLDDLGDMLPVCWDCGAEGPIDPSCAHCGACPAA